MTQISQSWLNYGRAVWTFILAYVVVTILAIALSVALSIAMHVTGAMPPVENPAYLLSERFLPFLNLFVWMAFAAIYFKRQMGNEMALRRESIVLGVFLACGRAGGGLCGLRADQESDIAEPA